MLIGVALVVLASFSGEKEQKGRVQGGGVVMIGPIPVVFGSDAKWASIAIILAVILVALSLLLYLV